MRRWMLSLAMGCAAFSAQAHPHVFLDTGLVLTFDSQHRLASIRVTWLYDAYFSMSLFADLGLDPEADGKLTAAELASLQGFNLDWPDGFKGDLYVESAGRDLSLSAPHDGRIEVREGRILSFLSRDLVQPATIGPEELTIRNYDPNYYNEYSVTAPPMFKNAPPGCTAQVGSPDLGLADRALQAELAKIPPGGSLEGDYPAVGRLYAQTVHVTCKAG